MMRRARSASVLAVLLGAAVALISSTQVWLDVTLGGATGEPLVVAGASAMPLLAPLSLAALALALALSIAGRVLRYAFGAIAIAIGLLVALGAAPIAADPPIASVTAAVTESTGIAGVDAVRALVSGIVASPWPTITVCAAVFIVAGGILTLATAHRWSGSGRRYRTDVAASAASQGSRPHDAIDSWDDLSRGDDPTA